MYVWYTFKRTYFLELSFVWARKYFSTTVASRRTVEKLHHTTHPRGPGTKRLLLARAKCASTKKYDNSIQGNLIIKTENVRYTNSVCPKCFAWPYLFWPSSLFRLLTATNRIVNVQRKHWKFQRVFVAKRPTKQKTNRWVWHKLEFGPGQNFHLRREIEESKNSHNGVAELVYIPLVLEKVSKSMGR